MDPHLVFLYQKNNKAQRSNISQFFLTIITRHTCSILGQLSRNKGQKYHYRACFMIFWGRKNIAGECSLKIPYSTIAVKEYIIYALFFSFVL